MILLSSRFSGTVTVTLDGVADLNGSYEIGFGPGSPFLPDPRSGLLCSDDYLCLVADDPGRDEGPLNLGPKSLPTGHVAKRGVTWHLRKMRNL
jgi:hypothetical protein